MTSAVPSPLPVWKKGLVPTSAGRPYLECLRLLRSKCKSALDVVVGSTPAVRYSPNNRPYAGVRFRSPIQAGQGGQASSPSALTSKHAVEHGVVVGRVIGRPDRGIALIKRTGTPICKVAGSMVSFASATAVRFGGHRRTCSTARKCPALSRRSSAAPVRYARAGDPGEIHHTVFAPRPNSDLPVDTGLVVKCNPPLEPRPRAWCASPSPLKSSGPGDRGRRQTDDGRLRGARQEPGFIVISTN